MQVLCVNNWDIQNTVNQKINNYFSSIHKSKEDINLYTYLSPMPLSLKVATSTETSGMSCPTVKSLTFEKLKTSTAPA